MIKTVLLFYFAIGVESKICKNTFDTDFNNTELINKEYSSVTINTVDDDFIQNLTLQESGCKCRPKKCVRKCCPEGYGFLQSQKLCVPLIEKFNPTLWNSYHRVDANVSVFNIVHGVVNCVVPNGSYRIRISKIAENYHLKLNGQLFIEVIHSVPPWILKTPDEYCVDTFISENEDGTNTTKFDAMVCFSPEKEDEFYTLNSTCMLISSVFILATVAVYAWLPELQNLHGRVLMAYLISFFVGFTLLAVMQILLMVDNISLLGCALMTIIIYFALLSAFFWLNIMCFDIWWTFSGKRGMNLEKLSTRRRFYAYAAYAFGIPFVLTVVMTSLEFSGLPPRPYMPLLRQQGCFIGGNSKLLYLYGPITIMCAANLVFFILTAIKIAKVNKQTSVLKSHDSQTHDPQRNDKQRLLLYVKLFSIMGVNWLLEVISAFYPDANEFWRFTDAYNVLVGLIIFIIFVCKRKIFALIKKRFKQRRGEPMSRTQTSSSRISNRDDTIQMTKVN